MLENLDSIDWKRLRHSYGSAKDVPAQIANLVSEDADIRDKAYEFLAGVVNHQGDVMSATAQVVPFLIELLQYEETPDKHHLLYRLSGFVGSCDGHLRWSKTMGDCNDLIDTYRNACAGVDTYIKLLSHPDIKVRFVTAELCTYLTDQGRKLRPALRKQIALETHPETQAQMIYAIGKLIRHNWRPGAKALARKYQSSFLNIVTSEPHQKHIVRLAAACTWIEADGSIFINSYPYNNSGREHIPAPIIQVLSDAFLHPIEQKRGFWIQCIHEATVFNYLVVMGIYVLAEILKTPDIEHAQAHFLVWAMLEKSFMWKISYSPPTRHYNGFGVILDSWKHYGNNFIYQSPHRRYGNNQFRPGERLTDSQRFTLTTIVNLDVFWEMPTNLFSFFYGLPDSRDALRKLIE